MELSLPEQPLTYEEIDREFKLIEEGAFQLHMEKLKNIKLRIQYSVSEKCEGISEKGDKETNLVKIMNLMEWMKERMIFFRDSKDVRISYLNKNKNLELFKKKLVSMEINFLDYLIRDFEMRLQKSRLLMRKCF